jgi:head-tail adaptor
MKRGPRGRNWTVEEREIIFEMARDGHPIDAVNSRLAIHQRSRGLSQREVPQSSYEMVKKTYAPYFNSDASLRELTHCPPPMGKLRFKKSV